MIIAIPGLQGEGNEPTTQTVYLQAKLRQGNSRVNNGLLPYLREEVWTKPVSVRPLSLLAQQTCIRYPGAIPALTPGLAPPAFPNISYAGTIKDKCFIDLKFG